MSVDKKPIIKPLKNGPYLVKELQIFKKSKKKKIMVNPMLTLCRCGGSKNKPFCNGQHWYVKFKDPKN